jgi:6-phosphogluconate dehydrogenase
VVALAVTNGVPAPGMMASLSYFDTYRRERLPANMVQVRVVMLLHFDVVKCC